MELHESVAGGNLMNTIQTRYLHEEGFVLIPIEEQDAALRILGLEPFYRLEILTSLEDIPGRALWVNYERELLAIQKLHVD